MGYPNIHIPYGQYIPSSYCPTWTCFINEIITFIIKNIFIMTAIFFLSWVIVTIIFGVLSRLSLPPNKPVERTKYKYHTE